MGRRILVPVDDSDRSHEALSYAVNEYPDADITALHVIDPHNYYSASGIEGGVTTSAAQLQENLENHADTLLTSMQDEAREDGVDIEVDRVTGSVANAIVSYAAEQDVDHIIMGSHGRSGTSRVLLGSVAETVTRRSPVVVTIVR